MVITITLYLILFIAAGPVLAASTAPNVPGTPTITVPPVTLLLAPTSVKELLAKVFAFPWSAASLIFCRLF